MQYSAAQATRIAGNPTGDSQPGWKYVIQRHRTQSYCVDGWIGDRNRQRRCPIQRNLGWIERFGYYRRRYHSQVGGGGVARPAVGGTYRARDIGVLTGCRSCDRHIELARAADSNRCSSKGNAGWIRGGQSSTAHCGSIAGHGQSGG